MLDVIMIRIRSFCWKLLRHKTYGYDILSLVFLDGIYPELATLVKTIPEPSDDDYKRIRYKKMQELARKDVEQAFGVLKKKWAILVNHTEKRKNKKYDVYMHHITQYGSKIQRIRDIFRLVLGGSTSTGRPRMIC
nr:hypothetical protein [Tanacetum cinerariifolium]